MHAKALYYVFRLPPAVFYRTRSNFRRLCRMWYIFSGSWLTQVTYKANVFCSFFLNLSNRFIQRRITFFLNIYLCCGIYKTVLLIISHQICHVYFHINDCISYLYLMCWKYELHPRENINVAPTINLPIFLLPPFSIMVRTTHFCCELKKKRFVQRW